VTVGPGWDHLTICGRRVNIPQRSTLLRGIALGTPLSFYVGSRTPLPQCEVAVYNFLGRSVKYLLKEVSYNVTDTLTGKSQPVKGLSGVAASQRFFNPTPNPPTDPYCAGHSSQELVTVGKCTGNISPAARGDRDGYGNVVENCKRENPYDATCGRPLINLSGPALP